MPDLTTPILGLTEPTVGADNGTWGGILNTDIVNLDTYLGVLRQAAKAVTVAATTTLDFSAPASVFSFTVSQATTIAFANVPANITAQQLSTQVTILITNGGAFAVTWPVSVTWSGGITPAFQASGTDVVVGWSPNNGTNWYLALLSPNPKVFITRIGQLAQVSTASGAEVSLGIIQLPAAKLVTNGDVVRIHITGFAQGSGVPQIRVKFGATYVASITFTTSGLNSDGFDAWITIGRLTATTQVATASEIYRTTPGVTYTPTLERTLPAETLANAINIDFRGLAGGAANLFLDSATVETITQ